MDQSNSSVDPSIAENIGLGDGRKHGKRVITFLVIALLVLAVVLWLAWQRGSNGESRMQYKTETVQRGNLTITVTATGNLEPTNQIEVGSELSGIIENVAVDYNDRVTVGQPLAALDTTKLKAKVLQSKASLSSARAKVLAARATADEARSKLSRLKQLRTISGSKAVSQQDLDAAQATLERSLADENMAKASVELAQATLEADETDLSKAVIVSPINGIVLSRDVDPGQTVAASLQAPVLFTLAEDLARMELIVDVDEADVGLVKAGQDAEFTVDAYPDRRFPAQITQVRYGAKTVDGVVTYATVLNVDNSDLSLRPGMTATATITVQKIEDALMVPNSALRFAPSNSEMQAATRRRGLIGSLIPRPPRPSSRQRPAGDDHRKRQRVWTLRDEQLTPISITIGPSDGTRTVVTGGKLQVDTPVVVDMVKVPS